ncbi:MAG TPA: SDR family NAD(P)-dependent oxidoreductase [Lachnospiraceae bacterium]|nr:SDR family NAD(P)-dependent oxidoreductase [Lachnospiraceae bacterium]
MKNSIAIITGATGGLGIEFVSQLINDVDEIWAIARNEEKLVNLGDQFGTKIKGFSIDLTDPFNLEKIRNRLLQEDVQVAYLVNNAGTGRMSASIDFSDTEIINHVNVHNTSMAILCNICLKYMGKGSHIINIASQAAFQPNPYINLYASSKVFCYSYSRALALELESMGITVTVVCPGWIKTDLLQTERNGVKIAFPHLAEAKDVVFQAIKDAGKGKNISVYSTYVRWQRFLSWLFPTKAVMKTWTRGIRKYI